MHATPDENTADTRLNEALHEIFKACEVSSDPEDAIQHPSFKTIEAMGTRALPFLLDVLKGRPDPHLMTIIQTIAGEEESPIPEEHEGRVTLMANDWVEWGKKKGYIK